MQEMVEPDRTILIVSIIGLVVIWGSVAYHRFVQDGRAAVAGNDEAVLAAPPATVRGPEEVQAQAGTDRDAASAAGPSDGGARRRGKGRKGRRR